MSIQKQTNIKGRREYNNWDNTKRCGGIIRIGHVDRKKGVYRNYTPIYIYMGKRLFIYIRLKITNSFIFNISYGFVKKIFKLICINL